MPPAKQADRIPISSGADLAAYFDDIEHALAEKETEHSWERLDRALLKLEAVAKGGGYKFEDFVPRMKAVAGPISRSLLSERTKLSGTAAEVLNSVAPRLAERFEPLVNAYVPPLLLLCARTNKVALKRAEKCLQLIAKHCRLSSMLPLLREACKDKFAGLRVVAVGTAATLIEYGGKTKLNRKVTDVEAIVQSAATDSNVEVRHTCKRLFELYVVVWPERVESFTTNFTPTIRRYLALPKTGAYRPSPEVFAAAAEAAKNARSQPTSELTAEPVVPSLQGSSHRSQSSRRGDEGDRAPAPDGFGSKAVAVNPEAEKHSRFLEQLAAAKAKGRPQLTNVQSTGALKGLSSSDVFGPQKSQRAGREEQREVFKGPSRRMPQDKPTMSRSVSACVAASEAARPGSSSSSSSASNAIGSPSTDARLAPPLPNVIQRSFSSHVASSRALHESGPDRPVSLRGDTSETIRTAPATPVTRDYQSLDDCSETAPKAHPAYEQTNQPSSGPGATLPAVGVTESDFAADSAPSDGVARRLASMAQEHRDRGLHREEREASGRSNPFVDTPVSRNPHASKKSAPGTTRAARVAVPQPTEPQPRGAPQRQPSATRVARPNIVAPSLTSDALSKASTSGHRAQPTAASSAQSHADLREAPKPTSRPAASPPKKFGPLKSGGKVVSSTTQSMGAKSKALSGASGLQSSSTPGNKRAGATASQSAREAIMAKKQAEVAKLRAQAKARSEQAAAKAAEAQASRQARAKQLREDSHHPHHPAMSASTSGGLDQLPEEAGSDLAAEQHGEERAIQSRSAWDEEYQPAGERTSADSCHGVEGASQESKVVEGREAPKSSEEQQSGAVPHIQESDVHTHDPEDEQQVSVEPPAAPATKTPHKSAQHTLAASSPPRNPLTPFSSSRRANTGPAHFSSPADKLRAQLLASNSSLPLNEGAKNGRSPFQCASQSVSPRRPTHFSSSRKGGMAEMQEDAQNDGENRVPSMSSHVSLVSNGPRNQLICGAAQEGFESEGDTLIDV